MAKAKEWMTVDEYVAGQVLPELQPVAAMIRSLMKEIAPEAQELVSYGMPAYKMRYIVAYFTPNQHNITFSFMHGVQFNDPQGLLRGSGKHARYVKLKQPEQVSKEILADYIRQAVALDA